MDMDASVDAWRRELAAAARARDAAVARASEMEAELERARAAGLQAEREASALNASERQWLAEDEELLRCRVQGREHVLWGTCGELVACSLHRRARLPLWATDGTPS